MPAVVLIHGIGHHAPGELTAEARRGLGTLSADGEDVREFTWSSIPGTVDDRWLSVETIRRMSAGLAGAAALGVERSAAALAAEGLMGLAVTVPVLAPLLTGLLLLVPGASFAGALRTQAAIVGALTAGWALAAVALLVPCAWSACARGETSPLLVWVRWLVLVVARPVALVALIPFAPFLWEFASLGGESSTALSWIGVTGALAASIGWLWGEPWAFLGNLAAAALVVGGVCLAGMIGQLVYAVFGPTLKALLDTFVYLGDPDNRAAIRAAFDRTVRDLPQSARGGRDVTIYAHSLGTVIALDSLAHSAAWTADDEVRLVTCGSPLRRLVLRFFPGALFPPSVGAVATRIAARLGTFQWTNFHRTLDYVGGSLELSRLGIGRDVRGRGFKSHSWYFSDPELWSATAVAPPPVPPAATERAGAQPARSEAGADARLEAGSARRRAVLSAVSRLVGASGFVLAPLTAVLFVLASVRTGGRLASDPADLVRASLNGGSRTSLATVTHWQVETLDESRDQVEHFSFQWDDGPTREIEVPGSDLSWTGYRSLFDVDGLRRQVRASCDLANGRAPLQRAIRVPCRARQPVQVRYAVARPDHFDLPAFPPRAPSWWRRGLDWVRLLAVGVGWCLLGGGMNVMIAKAWSRLVFGL